MSEAFQEAWTTRRLQAWMREAFARAGVDSPRLMSDMLLAHVLGCERLRLYTDADRPASGDELHRLRDLVKRALRHEPVQYLVGEASFYGLRFGCDARALVPRESTGVIVRLVLEEERRRIGEAIDGERRRDKETERVESMVESDEGRVVEPVPGAGPMILDVCTGSGCIAIALATQLPRARVIASDISGLALALAGENIARHGVGDRVELRQGDLLDPIAGDAGVAGRLDYLVANPPYIPDDEWDEVALNVRGHEPTLALRGGKDGMDLVRPILEQGPLLLAPGGIILVEVATRRAQEAQEILAGVPGVARATIHRDQDGLPRVVEGALD